MSGDVASYWNRPVSVTIPAYRHAAASAGMSPPMRRISRYTISAVDDAFGSITGIVPAPSLETWWSIQISSLAFFAEPSSAPSRSVEAQSSVTMTSGDFGNSFGGTRRPAPGSASTHLGCSNGTLP